MRKSNIELLRIFAMLAIIAGHMAHQTEILMGTTGERLLFVSYDRNLVFSGFKF